MCSVSGSTAVKCTSSKACISTKCLDKCPSSMAKLTGDCGCGASGSDLKLAKNGQYCQNNVV